MSYQEFLSFERRGAVGIVRLARPEKLNTISAPFYEAMIELQQAELAVERLARGIVPLLGVAQLRRHPQIFAIFALREPRVF